MEQHDIATLLQILAQKEKELSQKNKQIAHLEESMSQLSQKRKIEEVDVDLYEDDENQRQAKKMKETVVMGRLLQGVLQNTDNVPVDRELFRSDMRDISYVYAVCELYRFLVQEKGFGVLRELICQEGDTSAIVANILAGRTQCGKSMCIAAGLYLYAIGCGVIGLGLVRSQGGDESMLAISKALDKVSEMCVAHLSRREVFQLLPKGNLQRRDIKKHFTAKALTVTEFKKEFVTAGDEHRYRLGELHKPIIVLGRQNASTIRNLFNKPNSSFINTLNTHVKDGESQYNHLKMRVAIFSDEDDEVASSASRTSTARELANYHDKIKCNVVSKQDENSDTSSDSDSELSKHERERDLNGKELIQEIQVTVRGGAKLVVGVTATWFNLVLIKTEEFEQHVNVIELPVPNNYVGYFIDTEVPHSAQNIEINIVDPCVSTRGASTYEKHKKPLQHILSSLTFEYNLNQAENNGQHVSFHINTKNTNQNKHQEELVKDTIDLLSTGCDNGVHTAPAIGFVHNQQESRLFYLSQSMHDELESWAHGEGSRLVKGVWCSSDQDWIGYDEDTRVITMSIKRGKRFIRTSYDLAYRLFESVNLLPFVVCVSGNLGGRALTLKDSDHEYPLTDQYTEAAPTWRHGNQIQKYGRLCSVGRDGSPLVKRRLWCTQETKDMLRNAVKFEAEARKLYVENKNRKGLDFATAVYNMTAKEHPTMLFEFANPTLIAQPKVINQVRTDLEEIALRVNTGAQMDVDEQDMEDIQHQVTVVIDAMGIKPKRYWTVAEIVDLLSKNGQLYKDSVHSASIPEDAFVYKNTPAICVQIALNSAVSENLVDRKQDKYRIRKYM